jgi:hypothetical protein
MDDAEIEAEEKAAKVIVFQHELEFSLLPIRSETFWICTC